MSRESAVTSKHSVLKGSCELAYGVARVEYEVCIGRQEKCGTSMEG